MVFFSGDINANLLSIKGNTNSINGKLIINDNDNNGNISIIGPSTISESFTLSLPDISGNIDRILATDGNGDLNWIEQGVNNVKADDITPGSSEVLISTSSGNIVSKVPSSNAVLFQTNNTSLLTITSSSVLQPSSGWLIFGSDKTAIYSSSDGQLDVKGETEVEIGGDSNVYLESSTGINMESTSLVPPQFNADNALVFRDSNNYIYSSESANLNIVTVNNLNIAANEGITLQTTSSNSVIFDLNGGDSSDQIQMTRESSTLSYLNMSSVSQDSGIGFRNNNSQIEFKSHTNKQWQPLIGFVRSIVTVSTSTVVSIPAGTTAINIKAVAAGGGGGGTNNGGGFDTEGTGGGGGGGEYCDIYIDSSNIASNTSVYIEIGSGGTGSGASSSANGGNGGNTVITLVESGSNSGALVTLEGGKGGFSDNNSGVGGLGGNLGTSLSNCIGYLIPGASGESGYKTAGVTILNDTQGGGGRSHLGCGGRSYAINNNGTDGIKGGGGCGASDQFNYDAKNGGDGYGIILFY